MSRDIIITDSKFRQTGMNAVCITESSDIRITSSVFNDIGYHGVTSLYNSGWQFDRFMRRHKILTVNLIPVSAFETNLELKHPDLKRYNVDQQAMT